MNKKSRIFGLVFVLSLFVSGTTAQAFGEDIALKANMATKFQECAKGAYKNSAGHCVKSPSMASTWPSGSSAKCWDGTYSYSESRRGTCSHHGGVSSWR